MSQKSVVCLIIHNLKKTTTKIVIFGTQYPDDPSF